MQIRDWLYVEDHCKAIDMVANGGKIDEVYNVGGHNERSNIFIVTRPLLNSSTTVCMTMASLTR